MIFYTKQDVTITSNEVYGINKIIPKYSLVQIKRKAVLCDDDGAEFYVVYFKLFTGAISDTVINRRQLKYYARSVKDLWSNYGKYTKDLHDQLSL